MSRVDQQLALETAPVVNPESMLLPLTHNSYGFTHLIGVQLLRWCYGLDCSFDAVHYDATAPGLYALDTIGQPSVNFAAGTRARLNAEYAAAHPSVPAWSTIFRPSAWRPFREDIDLMPEDSWYHDASGNRILTAGTNPQPIVTPLAPDGLFDREATYSANQLAQVKAICPLSLIVHMGEVMMANPGGMNGAYLTDPAVIAVLAGMNDDQKLTYWSTVKRAQMRIIMTAAVAAAGAGTPTIFYLLGDLLKGIRKDGHKWLSTWDFADTHDGVTSYPAQQEYYYGQEHWTGGRTALTEVIGLMSQAIPLGHPLGCFFVSGGWAKDMSLNSPLNTLMGFVKCLYAVGMRGCIPFYNGDGTATHEPQYGKDGQDVGSTLPWWVQQAMLFGENHAMWTWLQDYLLNGTLLPGIGMSAVNPSQPSYEFTSTITPNVRVIVRKHNTQNEWLICAWAANGIQRIVTVTIPDLGTVQLNARAEGTVYIAMPGPTLRLQDIDGMHPSRSINLPSSNHAPVAVGLTLSAGSQQRIAIMLQATDVDGDLLEYSVITAPTHGVLTGDAPYLDYCSVPGYVGADSFTFRAYDGLDYSNIATVNITVRRGGVVGRGIGRKTGVQAYIRADGRTP